MPHWQLVVTGYVLACGALAQTQWVKEHEEIRRVIARYHEAERRANPDEVAAVTTEFGPAESPGATVTARMVDRARIKPESRSTLIRRVSFLNESTAIALGVWREFGPSPFGTGTVEYALVKGSEGWRIAHRHDAYLPEPRQVATRADVYVPGKGHPDADGWETLFDGKTFTDWESTDSEYGAEVSWRIEDGSLAAIPDAPRVSLITRQQYLFYDLRFEWRAEVKTNSGVKYRLLGFDRIGGRSREALGFEYQVADDEGDPGARVDPTQRAGTLYTLTGVERSVAKSLGEWNESRIIVLPDRVEHWLNGQQTAKYATDISFASAIVVQHHMSDVRFRNIRIKRIDAMARKP